MDNLISKINFFSDKATFETINDSNSGAILRKVKFVLSLEKEL